MMPQAFAVPSISPLRALAIGLSLADVMTWYSLSQEEIDALQQQQADRRKTTQKPISRRAGTLMTRLLLRPDLDAWETKTAERL